MTTQPEAAVGGVEEIPAEAPNPFDELAEEMLGDDDEEDEEAAEAPPEDEIEESDLAEPEPDPYPAPISLNAEEKVIFETLPEAAKAFTSRRIGELERAFYAKAQEASNARQTAEMDALRYSEQVQAEAVQHLQQYAEHLKPKVPDARLAQTDPAAYAYMLQHYHETNAQREQAQRDAQAAMQRQQAYQSEIDAREKSTHRLRLQSELPEAFDPANGQQFINELAATARALDYDDHALSQASVEELKALKLAAQWKAKADKYDNAVSKKTGSAKAPTPTAKPGTPQGSGTTRKRRADAAWETAKAAKTGNARNQALADWAEQAGFI